MPRGSPFKKRPNEPVDAAALCWMYMLWAFLPVSIGMPMPGTAVERLTRAERESANTSNEARGCITRCCGIKPPPGCRNGVEPDERDVELPGEPESVGTGPGVGLLTGGGW